MDYRFPHSHVVIHKLAQVTARTPLSEDDTPTESVDRSLTILGRALDIHSERIEEEFSQRQFIASHSKEGEDQINKRLKKLEKNMDQHFQDVDRRFDEMEKNMDQRFQDVDRRMLQRLNTIQNASRNILQKVLSASAGRRKIGSLLVPGLGVESQSKMKSNTAEFSPDFSALIGQ